MSTVVRTVEDIIASRRIPTHDLIVQYVSASIKEGNVPQAIRTLYRAVQILRSNMLSPSHAALVELLMNNQMYAQAKVIFEVDVYVIEPKQTTVDFEDFIKYFTYKGKYHAIHRQWEASYRAFETVLIAQGVNESFLGNVAYACAIIVGSLVGRSPSHIDSTFNRAARRIAQSLETGDRDGAAAAVETHRSEIAGFDDVCQAAVEDVTAHALLRLTRVYCTLPLSEVAAAASLTPVGCKALITSLVAQGRLLATIDPTTGIVSFEDAPTTDCVAQLEEGISSAIQMCDSLDVLNQVLTTSFSYLLASGNVPSEISDAKH